MGQAHRDLRVDGAVRRGPEIEILVDGLPVRAFMVPYGVSTLFYGLPSDRLDRRPISFASLLTFVVLTALTATAQPASQMIAWRLATGLGASGIVPPALALDGRPLPL